MGAIPILAVSREMRHPQSRDWSSISEAGRNGERWQPKASSSTSLPSWLGNEPVSEPSSIRGTSEIGLKNARPKGNWASEPRGTGTSGTHFRTGLGGKQEPTTAQNGQTEQSNLRRCSGVGVETLQQATRPQAHWRKDCLRSRKADVGTALRNGESSVRERKRERWVQAQS
jgi:hypothetical protein